MKTVIVEIFKINKNKNLNSKKGRNCDQMNFENEKIKINQKNFEDNYILKEELRKEKEKLKDLRKNNNELKKTLQQTDNELKKIVNQKERMIKEIDTLKLKLKNIKNGNIQFF